MAGPVIARRDWTSSRRPDQLAATGVRFTRCYVQPLCTPTRVQIMTGLYNVRNYVNFGTLDRRAVTFAHRLKEAGYATGIAGKWQLGHEVDSPQHFGFDESCLWQHTRRPPRYSNPGLEFNSVERDFKDGQYGPDLVNDFARDFVARHRGRPFFLYYPMILTHGPYQATPDSAAWDPKAMGEKVNIKPEHFGDMVTYMDKLIGQLVDKLDELGVRENTLLLFVGDNGTGRGTRSMMGDRVMIGGKGTTTAAGMHVPLIASWPGRIASGKVCPDLVDSTDFLPTLLDAAGLSAEPSLDGRSFFPQLRGERGQPRDWIYSWYSPRQSGNKEVREFAFNAQFKLYRTGEFYDLRNDVGEQRPLKVPDLEGDAATAARLLQSALDRFTNARPAELDNIPMESARGKKNRKRKAQ